MKLFKKDTGQASLVMVLLIGLVAISSAIASSSLTVSNVTVEETIHSNDQAWYAAWAGIDEIMYRLRAKQNFGAGFTVNLALGNNATAAATITGDNNQKTVDAVGYYQGVIKRLEVKVASSSAKASFIFAAQSGTGGFILESTTLVTGNNGTDGNIYSNGDVLGQSASSGNNGSRVMGSIWSVGSIRGISSPTSGGVYIKKNAWANALTACTIGGNVKAPQPPSNCPYGGTYTVSGAPPSTSLITVDTGYWMNQAANGRVWNGDCDVLSGGASDCTLGTGKLGNLEVVGNVNVGIGKTIGLTGPVWIKGNLVLNNNVIVNTDNLVGSSSAILVASDPDNPNTKGTITTNNNVQYNRNSSGAGPIFISENHSTDCTNLPAIGITNNATTVVLIAVNGCINVGNNSVMNGIIADKIHLYNNATINYDPSLAKAIVDPGSGGWAVVSIKEY